MRISLPTPRKRLISLTPLIDVVFILLVFFMLASSFLEWHSIELNAPVDKAAGSSMEGAILVRIKTDGGLDVNGERVDMGHLGERVRTHLERRPEQRILVQPEARVPVQSIVTVLDRLTEAGASHISLLRD